MPRLKKVSSTQTYYKVSFIEYFRVLAGSPTEAVQKVFDGKALFQDGWSVDIKEHKTIKEKE